ncbi:MAG: hypothetical protein U9R05_09635 [Chloroflexota bacterium]|nr:hypothetical protein [Chloroflexota bacterium]
MEHDFGLHIINSDGTDMRPITSEELLQRGLLFHLPFVPGEMVKQAEEAGHFRRHFSVLPLFSYNHIRWLPDGSAWIEPGEDGLYIIRADGTGSTRVIEGSVYYFDLSPDGRTIAYAEGKTISSINTDGSEQRELARFQAQVGDVRWSPGGDQILISTSRHSSPISGDDLYVVDFDTQRVQSLFHLTHFDKCYLVYPQWSVDGQRVEFIMCDWGRDGIYINVFSSLTKDGNDQQQVAQITGSNGCVSYRAWSPNHAQFIFSMVPGFAYEGLYVYDISSEHHRPILSGYVAVGPMLWAPSP